MSKKKHEEAHGGAWKVAYADFVTAMMALFMVLWICAQEDEILVATTEYFSSPFSSPMPASSGVMTGKQESINYDDNEAKSHAFTPDMYKQLAKEFLKLLDLPEDEEDDQPVSIKVTKDGIVISVFNRTNQPIFEGPSLELTPWGDFVSQNLAWVIDRFHMGVRLGAYIPENVLSEDSEFDPWTLTSGQANAFRASLVHYGLDASKVDYLTGYGDTNPVEGVNPNSTDNYRVDLTLSATGDTPVPSAFFKD